MKSGQVFLLIKKRIRNRILKGRYKTFSFQLSVTSNWQPATIIFAFIGRKLKAVCAKILIVKTTYHVKNIDR